MKATTTGIGWSGLLARAILRSPVGPDRVRSILVCSALMVTAVPLAGPMSAQVDSPTRPSSNPEEARATQEVRSLALEEALERAHASNPTYLRAVNNLELNEIEGREFWLDFLPEPRITLLQTAMQWNRSTIGTDNFGNPIPNPELRMIQSARSDQFATLAWELDFGDFFRHQAVQLRGREREVEVERVSNHLASEVRSAFLEAQQTLEFRRLEERLVDLQEVTRDMAERRFRLGRLNRPDLLGARLDHVEQQARLEESRARLTTAVVRLRNVIGDPDLGTFEISPTPLRTFDPDDLDTRALVDEALEAGPDARAARIGMEAAERDVSLGGAAWLPTLSVNATTGRRQLSRGSGGAFLRAVPDGEWDRAVGFTLRFPDIGTFFRRRASARREEIEVRNAKGALTEVRLRVKEEVSRLVQELRSQYGRLNIQERRLKLARERLELQQERYRLGRIDYLHLQSSVETVADAERQTVEARYVFERALIELERARGLPVEIPDGT